MVPYLISRTSYLYYCMYEYISLHHTCHICNICAKYLTCFLLISVYHCRYGDIVNKWICRGQRSVIKILSIKLAKLIYHQHCQCCHERKAHCWLAIMVKKQVNGKCPWTVIKIDTKHCAINLFFNLIFMYDIIYFFYIKNVFIINFQMGVIDFSLYLNNRINDDLSPDSERCIYYILHWIYYKYMK